MATPNTFCAGKHPVSGEKGCFNEACHGHKKCVPGCFSCPDYVHHVRSSPPTNEHCAGKHPVDGKRGCHNAGCRGRQVCAPDCFTCPDYVAHQTGGAPLPPEPRPENGHSTTLFGQHRSSGSIKTFMACLAGPADPETRNDIELMDKFRHEHHVMPQHQWMFLEHQASQPAVTAALDDATDPEVIFPDDFLFVYLGGHGSAEHGSTGYRLGTYKGSVRGEDVARLVCRVPCRVFLIADSCHSGAMINDVKEHLKDNPLRCESLTILTSIQAELPATTGWKLIQFLIEGLSSDAPEEDLARLVCAQLRTSTKQQRAQMYCARR